MFYSCNIVLHTLAKDCKEILFAIADAYNIRASQALHLDSSTLKSLFWEHFAKTSMSFLLYFSIHLLSYLV